MPRSLKKGPFVRHSLEKKVSNNDWCEEAIRNFSLQIIFSFPFITILVDKKVFKHSPAQKPINLPPTKTTFWGRKKEGKNIIEMNIIPE